MTLLEDVIALVVPPRCAACRATGDVLCGACRRALPWLTDPRCERCALPLPHRHGGRCPAGQAAFDTAWAAVAYDGRARDALIALKFAAARPLAAVMAAQIHAAARRHLQPGVALVAVPAHPRRRRARGFDPTQLIATQLARRTGLPLVPALRRSARASRQLGASRAARRDPAGLDVLARGPAPPSVVLVDDVHTTGATLHACALALRHAGCRQIAAITWARTLDDRLG